MNTIELEVSLSGLTYTDIFGFENLKELSSQNNGETRIRVYAIHKETGVPQNYLVKIKSSELGDVKFMAALKEHIRKSFVGVIDGDPK